jgi:DNA polymerase III delta prime subunit
MAFSPVDQNSNPQVFNRPIFGHEKVIQRLLSSKKQIPHALLFSGPDSVGKKLVASLYAKKLLSSDAETESLQKERALQFDQKIHPDFHVVLPEEGKRDIPIETIRELIQTVSYRSFYGGKSVILIDQAEKLSRSAANALLKTLEEPPAHAHFLLISSTPHLLPETILSRCQTVLFGELQKEKEKLALEFLLSALPKSDLLQLSDFSQQDFIDPLSGIILNEKDRDTFIKNQLQDAQALASQITTLLKPNVHDPLSVITTFMKETPKPLHAILKRIRDELSSSPERAELALKLSESMHLHQTRNAQAELQVLSILFS